ncbi:MAG TPA: sugar ABC transporter substrate-binding protein [Candidatus Omnitrophota bacterium]|jgi:ABC-type glycerol-3-phosphate transport system substrate-binding protein|nr:MAG: putative ABC transporter substrate-binding protein YesO [Candidatus Omnitrophica bacterium ADurb.Bin314]HOE68933.1 sugar ABC transporter substrate-binding protein [Candidatus Omnitrophota bacterium]HQB94760.1 sugar ABC transporter substrate-binding protein [Candidatus Omnitrophota bacterium]
MKIKWVMRLFVYSVLLTSFVFSGCGAGPRNDGKTGVKVSFWGTPEEIDIITQALSDWQKEHPEIKVVFEHTPYTGYTSKILTRIAGGAAPDIIATEVDYFVTFASKGVLEDLTPYVDQDPSGFRKDDFFPQIIDRFTYDGKLMALPRDIAPFACVYYNKKLFDAAGLPYPTDDWTWNDLLRIARDLTQKDESGRVTQYGFYGWAWQNFIYGNGGALVDDVKNPTRTMLDDPKTIEGLQFYSDMSNLYGVMPTPMAFMNFGMGADRMFANDRVAMFLSGIWETPLFRNYNISWDVVMFPKNAAGVRAFGTGGTGYCILKSSKHKKEAWEVIKALTGPKGQELFAKRGLSQPARIEVAKGDAFANDPQPPANKKMLNEAVRHVVFSPLHPQWREIEEKILKPRLELVFNGKKRAEEVIKEVAAEINATLKR